MSQAWPQPQLSCCTHSKVGTVQMLTHLRKGWKGPGLASESLPLQGSVHPLQPQLLFSGSAAESLGLRPILSRIGPSYILVLCLLLFPCLLYRVSALQSLLSFLWSPISAPSTSSINTITASPGYRSACSRVI